MLLMHPAAVASERISFPDRTRLYTWSSDIRQSGELLVFVLAVPSLSTCRLNPLAPMEV